MKGWVKRPIINRMCGGQPEYCGYCWVLSGRSPLGFQPEYRHPRPTR